TLALTGNGAPGSTVEILIDGQAVGTAQVSGDGAWSFTTELVEPGDHTIGVRTAEATSTVTVTPTLVGGVLLLTGNGEPGSEVQILIDGEVAGSTQVGSDGAWSFTTTLTEPGDHTINVRSVSEATAPTFTAPTEGAELPPGEVRFSGTGKPGDEVIVSDNGVLAGTAIVNSGGEWSLIYKPASGVHTFGVRQAGNPALAGTVTATVLSPPITHCVGEPGVNLGDVYIVGACDTLTRISRITGVGLSALIAANPQIKDPDVIVPGQVIDIPR
ncbi:MAG: LysM peptidoglycan-binding domain-containing protein, partial [Chloroflexota bacterium]